jgi:hypothetical protein
MSAGFRIAGEVFWGTNGAVEAYVEVMAAEAANRFGPDDPLAAFLRNERNEFWGGKIISLDARLTDAGASARFLAVLEAATEHLLRVGAFTEYGREWVSSVIGQLRERIGSIKAPGPGDPRTT